MIRITNGTIVDPANQAHEIVADIWIEGEKIVAPPTEPHRTQGRVIDASGMIVMPGGIDIHCHIAGGKVNAARKMFPMDSQGTNDYVGGDALMATVQTGRRYAGLGYTTAFDAAVPVHFARQAQMELQDTPHLDTGFYVLVGNHRELLELARDGNQELLTQKLHQLLASTGAYAPKLVNPGGVEYWKRGGGNRVGGIDTVIDNDSLTPRRIIAAICQAANELDLPHPVHIHCNDLGRPGNWQTTLETMRCLNGQRAHLTHIQFHSYGDGDDDHQGFGSAVEPLVEFVDDHPKLSVDVGQVLFGKTASLTGDGALGEYLYRINGKTWFNQDVELEAGCGISPLVYRHRSLVSAWQWMIGLEWFLTARDLWQVCLSTDHPNGGSFAAYPQLIEYLMSADRRRETLRTLNPQVIRKSNLPQLDRELSLIEIAIITRAAPARVLGLHNKGHLGIGADADITIYDWDPAHIARMFELPRYVLQRGKFSIDF